MLTQEMNVFLTRTGPGTPMGELFRRYWIPALLDSELPERDCPPVRVKLLGERLVAFRDSEGRIGIIDEFCAHRGVSLWFGRNEECGLRCSYHGWKYDVNGQCVDLPSEPEESRVRQRIKLKSYPCVEGRSTHRSEEHTSELQSHSDLVCRLLLEKKKAIVDGIRRCSFQEQTD